MENWFRLCLHGVWILAKYYKLLVVSTHPTSIGHLQWPCQIRSKKDVQRPTIIGIPLSTNSNEKQKLDNYLNRVSIKVHYSWAIWVFTGWCFYFGCLRCRGSLGSHPAMARRRWPRPTRGWGMKNCAREVAVVEPVNQPTDKLPWIRPRIAVHARLLSRWQTRWKAMARHRFLVCVRAQCGDA